jgi:hypothetical protein
MRPLHAALLAAALGLALAAASPARAEEGTPTVPKAGPPTAAPPTGPSAILQLINRQPEVAEPSLRESLRPDLAPAPASRLDAPERMPDGSVRYGRSRVNVKVNADCPDDPFHEMAPPPVRRTR